MPAVPSQRGVGGRERGAGVLLLQGGLRARRGGVPVQRVHARDVQQPVGEAGMFELHDRDVLGELQRDGAGDVPLLSGGAVVSGGQREL